MLKLAARIRKLYEEDAVHRKGFRIRAATPELAGANAAEELGELLLEMAMEKIERLSRREKKREELADFLAIAVHLMMLVEADCQMDYQLAGDLALEALEQQAIEKINKRFTSANKRSS